MTRRSRITQPAGSGSGSVRPTFRARRSQCRGARQGEESRLPLARQYRESFCDRPPNSGWHRPRELDLPDRRNRVRPRNCCSLRRHSATRLENGDKIESLKPRTDRDLLIVRCVAVNLTHDRKTQRGGVGILSRIDLLADAEVDIRSDEVRNSARMFGRDGEHGEFLRR